VLASASVPVPPPIVSVTRPTIVLPAPTPRLAISRGMVRLYPEEAVMKAASAAPGFISAVFDFTVRGAAQVGPDFFLNSEEDYRDQRNISAVLGPDVQRQLRNSFGDDLSKHFVGRHLLVLGPAKRVQIDFIGDDGIRSGKYYYQTHVAVVDPRQLDLGDPR
ncbi:MAG: hypothetical protein ACJ8FO_02590, partial [Sphingomicrobium sp.]